MYGRKYHIIVLFYRHYEHEHSLKEEHDTEKQHLPWNDACLRKNIIDARRNIMCSQFLRSRLPLLPQKPNLKWLSALSACEMLSFVSEMSLSISVSSSHSSIIRAKAASAVIRLAITRRGRSFSCNEFKTSIQNFLTVNSKFKIAYFNWFSSACTAISLYLWLHSNDSIIVISHSLLDKRNR